MLTDSTTTTGSSLLRLESFPAGLRVLAVDDDPTWLIILERMLKKCSYEVPTCGGAIEALELLRKRKHGFDIVISDDYMPDMDCFKLLEHISLEMDLPVIMMSADGEKRKVMKSIQQGACDYLIKLKVLQNIWQHVDRKKKIHEVSDLDSHDGFEETQLMKKRSDDGYFLNEGQDMVSANKRKYSESKDFAADPDSSSSATRSRL